MSEPIDATRRALLIAGTLSPVLAMKPTRAFAAGWKTLAVDKAAPAIEIADMFGVCIGHSKDGGWGNYLWHPDEVARALNDIGATWVRTRFEGDADQVEFLRFLANRCGGLKFQCPMGLGHYDRARLRRMLELIARDDVLRNRIVRLEGANEWNLRAKHDGWARQLITHQTHLFQLAKNREIPLKHREVVGFSIGNPLAFRGAFDELRDINPQDDYSGLMDYGNVHLYIGGNAPETRPGLQFVLDESRALYGKPLVFTETGFHDYEKSKTHKYTPPQVAGEYTPRVILDYFKRGIRRMSMYELVDNGLKWKKPHEGHLGLHWARGGRFEKKPMGRAWKQLQELALSEWLLGARGGESEPTAWEKAGISIDKHPDVDRVETVLLRGHNGRALLCIWRPDTSRYDVKRKELMHVDGKRISLKFDRRMNFTVHCLNEKPIRVPNTFQIDMENVDARVRYIQIEPA